MVGEDGTAPLLAAIAVHKRYGARRAIDGISLAVHAGEIVGLLGPNGAGKTTMLSILGTILRPDAGRVLIDGAAAGTARSRHAAIGLVPQRLALYPSLSAIQNVWHFGRMQGLSRRWASWSAPTTPRSRSPEACSAD
jgi:ABC-type multidrug transport system ATPase subunit